MAEEANSTNTDRLSVQLNEAFARLERQQHSNDGPPTDRSPKINTESTTNPFSFVGLLLSLIAIGIATYAVYFTFRPAGTDLAGSGDELAARLGNLESKLSADTGTTDVTARLDDLTARLAGLDASESERLTAIEARVDTNVAELKQQFSGSRRDWVLAEAEYLLRLGNQRALLEKDAVGAAAMFRAADEIIMDAEGIAAFELRGVIARDVAALDAVAEVDIDGIFVRLVALTIQVENLQRKQQVFKVDAQPRLQDMDPAAGFGDKVMIGLSNFGARLATLVDFRRGDEKIEPLLPPEEEYYLRQNLILKLQVAELGLLRLDDAVYSNSLNEAQSWIIQYFDPDHAATSAMLRSLAELSEIPIARQIPDVSASLREIRKLHRGFTAPQGVENRPE